MAGTDVSIADSGMAQSGLSDTHYAGGGGSFFNFAPPPREVMRAETVNQGLLIAGAVFLCVYFYKKVQK